MPPYSIRLLGDPVLKQKATDIDDVDGALVRLADDMVLTLNEAAGLGLAAPQVGVQKRLFVYDLRDGEGPKTIVNPVVVRAPRRVDLRGRLPVGPRTRVGDRPTRRRCT